MLNKHYIIYYYRIVCFPSFIKSMNGAEKYREQKAIGEGEQSGNGTIQKSL
jgi:hypothetical protein